MEHAVPLTSLLSQVLVALTIETDNEYEHSTPHLTTDHGMSALGPGAWLISTAMFVNFLRFVPAAGLRMAELAASAGATTPVHPAYHGMRHWGFVRYSPDIKGSGPRVQDGEAIVSLTPAGSRSQQTWRQAMSDVEARWVARGLDQLRDALVPVAQCVDRPLPEYFPVLGFQLDVPVLAQPVSRPPTELGLLALLSQVSLAMTYDFEAVSPTSLAVCADLLRPLGIEPTLVRDLPDVSGVAKQVWSSAVGQLTKLGLLVTEPAATGRGKSVRLTPAGLATRDTYPNILAAVEEGWKQRCGSALERLRVALEDFVGDGTAAAPVFEGLSPYPDGWRVKHKPPSVLPHQPMVLHRGGYPDGS